MRVVLIIAWFFVALAGVIFHFGPGREQAKLDRLDQLLLDARRSVANQQWGNAVEKFDLALAEVPSQKIVQSRQIVLEKAKAQMMAAQLPAARQTLEQLLADARQDPKSPLSLNAEIESALANSQYYMTWLMRLEGLKKEEWLPEIESARQHFAQVSQMGKDLGDFELVRRGQEDLEASVRLARMDLNELQGLPLPSQ
jgi:hypothetical protein